MRKTKAAWRGHWLDRAWVRLQPGLRLFEGGWGDETVGRLLTEHAANPPVPEPAPVIWDGPERSLGRGQWREGRFESPLHAELLPAESREAHFGIWLPAGANENTPVVVHIGGVGDEGYRLRRHLSSPLLRQGVGALILENPFYGARRPAGQSGTALRRVSDQLLLSGAVVAEACALLAWLRDRGYRRLGVTGYSMGGSAAGLVGAMFREPIAVAACAAGISGTPVFTEGLLSTYVAWDRLGPNRTAAVARFAEALAPGGLDRFAPPVGTTAMVLLAARHDGYVPAASVEALQQHWVGAELRWMPGGHISSFLTKRRAICAAIATALAGLD